MGTAFTAPRSSKGAGYPINITLFRSLSLPKSNTFANQRKSLSKPTWHGLCKRMRRFTLLTKAFSKKIKYHVHATALRYMHYNFCRVHQTLRVTPAMEAGVADHVWGVQEIADLLESR